MSAHNFYLELCLNKAWENQLETLPNPAVGALVLDKHKSILSLESHKECGSPHAEVLALQKAYARLSGKKDILALRDSKEIHNYLLKHAKDAFKHTTLYVTLEPCSSKKQGKTPSCAKLLKSLRPKCVIIGAQDIDKSAKGGAKELEKSGISVIKAWKKESLKNLNNRAKELLLPFRILQTQKRFVLFKYASRLDGSINGGQISSKIAQSKMHNYRTKADFLLISGKTVREDSPSLDSRFATLKKRSPNVLILTHQTNFPKTAPLFDIPHREVSFIHELKDLQNTQGFIFCEGGAALLCALKECMDMLLVILNPSFDSCATLRMSLQEHFKLLHSTKVGDDLFLYLMPLRATREKQ